MYLIYVYLANYKLLFLVHIILLLVVSGDTYIVANEIHCSMFEFKNPVGMCSLNDS